jgi:hypothetical protein
MLSLLKKYWWVAVGALLALFLVNKYKDHMFTPTPVDPKSQEEVKTEIQKNTEEAQKQIEQVKVEETKKVEEIKQEKKTEEASLKEEVKKDKNKVGSKIAKDFGVKYQDKKKGGK